MAAVSVLGWVKGKGVVGTNYKTLVSVMKFTLHLVSIPSFCLKTFHTSCVVPFKSEVSTMTELVNHLKSLSGHPPVEELCQCVRERYDWLVSTLDVKYTATQKCCRMAREFEQGEGC